MARLTVTVDEGLLDEARRLAGLRTKRETIAAALKGLIRQKRREGAVENCGRIGLDLDQATLQDYRARG